MRLPLTCLLLLSAAVPATAQTPTYDELLAMKKQLEAERAALEAQRARLQALEDALLERMRATGMRSAGSDAAQAGVTTPSAVPDTAAQPVGEPPAEREPGAEAAVLADQGGVITRAGRVTVEGAFEYARADRNRFVFRGIQVPQSVLVGAFDINESRQDLLTAAALARVGLTDWLEIGARVPFVYRSDKSVVVPVANPNPNAPAVSSDLSIDDQGLGDIELTARYQLTDGRGGWPFLIAGLQVITPTGTSPFKVDRDTLGRATEAATGAGFWGVAPTITALLPTDPAVLFGTLGYTFNFARDINERIGATLIERVDPGDSPSASAGIGIALNQRTSVSFAYAHSWSFATKTRLRQEVPNPPLGGPTLTDPVTTKTRQLQIGRYIFGVSYRANRRTTINWSVEVGATEDATDLRTTLRIPFALGY